MPQSPSIKFPSWLTLLTALLLIGLTSLLLFSPNARDNLGNLHYPAESAGRIWDRHLEFYEGYEKVPHWERKVHEFLFGSRAQIEEEAIRVYREVLRYLADHREVATPWALLNTRARLSVTLAETSRFDELDSELQYFDGTLDEAAIRDALNLAYRDKTAETPLAIASAGAALMPLGWASDHLKLTIATKADNQNLQRSLETRLQLRGERLRFRTLILVGAIAVLILGGVLCLLHLRTLLTSTPPHDSILTRPWSAIEGLSVAIYAAMLGVVITILLNYLGGSYFRPGLLSLWSTLFASLPMLWFMHHWLLQPRGHTLSSAFGLNIKKFGVSRLAVISLAVFAVDAGGTLLISWMGWHLGLESHWSQGLQERMIFGPWQSTLLGVVNVAVWGPIFEELGFRGLVYTSLRARFSPLISAFLCAALFSVLHPYSLVGFLSVFWSGLVLAFAFERFRSLLPGMVVHMLSNTIAVSTVLLFYR